MCWNKLGGIYMKTKNIILYIFICLIVIAGIVAIKEHAHAKKSYNPQISRS